MLLKFPQQEKIYWTKHSKMKMRQYRFSEKRVLRILRKPARVEEGIAPGTIAAMQITGTKKHPTEAWMMYQIKKSKIKNQKLKMIKIISAWRYPGRTPIGKRPIIPEDTLEELDNLLKE
jgi:hypothetical protein